MIDLCSFDAYVIIIVTMFRLCYCQVTTFKYICDLVKKIIKVKLNLKLYELGCTYFI